jgi:hypothetical protein
MAEQQASRSWMVDDERPAYAPVRRLRFHRGREARHCKGYRLAPEVLRLAVQSAVAASGSWDREGRLRGPQRVRAVGRSPRRRATARCR